MSSSNIRRTNLTDKAISTELIEQFSNGGISISEINSTQVASLCENYPYPEQLVYSGEIIYTEDGMWGTGREYPIKFQYRTESDLLILNLDVDASLDDIIDQLNQSAPEDVKIYRNLTVSREKLWKFFRSADKMIDIYVLDERGQKVPKEEIKERDEEPLHFYPIEDATVIFTEGQEQIVVQYERGNLSINSSWSDASEYIVQLFERDVITG